MRLLVAALAVLHCVVPRVAFAGDGAYFSLLEIGTDVPGPHFRFGFPAVGIYHAFKGNAAVGLHLGVGEINYQTHSQLVNGVEERNTAFYLGMPEVVFGALPDTPDEEGLSMQYFYRYVIGVRPELRAPAPARGEDIAGSWGHAHRIGLRIFTGKGGVAVFGAELAWERLQIPGGTFRYEAGCSEADIFCSGTQTSVAYSEIKKSSWYGLLFLRLAGGGSL